MANAEMHPAREISPTLLGAAIGVVVILIVIAYFVASNGSSNVQQGGNQNAPAVDNSPAAAVILKCVSACKQIRSTGVDLSDGLCLVEDLNGYGCAVADKSGRSPCSSAGSEPQIMMSPDCTFKGVVR